MIGYDLIMCTKCSMRFNCPMDVKVMTLHQENGKYDIDHPYIDFPEMLQACDEKKNCAYVSPTIIFKTSLLLWVDRVLFSLLIERRLAMEFRVFGHRHVRLK